MEKKSKSKLIRLIIALVVLGAIVGIDKGLQLRLQRR